MEGEFGKVIEKSYHARTKGQICNSKDAQEVSINLKIFFIKLKGIVLILNTF